MIKPLDEYSPEDRALVEYVEHLRRQPLQPGSACRSFAERVIYRGAGPIKAAEIRAILADRSFEDGE